MNVSDFIHILQKPDPVLSSQQTRALEAIVEEYPFFQAARALYLKGLQHLDSYRYHKALKVTAACTADRELLFRYINAEEFAQHTIAHTIADRLPDTEANTTSSRAIALPQTPSNPEEVRNPLKSQSKQDNPEVPCFEPPLPSPNATAFVKSEKRSFTEWLRVTDTAATEVPAPTAEVLDRKKKFALLDKFIENKPKIVPKAQTTLKVNLEASTTLDQNELMTETLAKIYVEQKKYKKAIQAYTILRLKYPEKSGFFADRIRALQQLQKESE